VNLNCAQRIMRLPRWSENMHFNRLADIRLFKVCNRTVGLIAINFGLLFLLLSPLAIPLIVVQYGIWSRSVRSGFAFRMARWAYLELYRQGIVGLKPCFVFDEKLLYRGSPFATCYSRNVEFSVDYEFNEFGVRDASAALVSPQTLVLGDSHAMGWGVDSRKRFSSLLSDEFGSILNMGISSYGTARELLIMKLFYEKYPGAYSSVRNIVIQYCVNDFGENGAFGDREYVVNPNSTYSQQPLSSLVSGIELTSPLHLSQLRHHARSLRRLVPYFWTHYLADLVSLFRVKGLSLKVPPSPLNVPSPLHGQAFVKTFTPYRSLLSGKNIYIIISTDYGAWNESVYADLRHSLSRLRKSLPSSNIVLLNTATVCGSECYFRLDDHLNEHGHSRLARLLNGSRTGNSEPVTNH